MQKWQKILTELLTLTLILICSVLLLFASCSNNPTDKSSADKIIADSSDATIQKTDSVPITKEAQTKIYSQAIAEFIKAVYKKDKTVFDTLFFGKNPEFPDIELPETIENTHIRLLSPEAGTKSQNEKKSRVYINLVGWIDKEKAEFIFVVFSSGFAHQYDYSIVYKYNGERYEFELKDLQFKGPPFDK
jgi:hypothetical protein